MRNITELNRDELGQVMSFIRDNIDVVREEIIEYNIDPIWRNNEIIFDIELDTISRKNFKTVNYWCRACQEYILDELYGTSTENERALIEHVMSELGIE
jgi:hypothetical protein